MAAVPPGLHLVATSSALGPLLDRLGALDGTRLATLVVPARAELSVCPDRVWVTELPAYDPPTPTLPREGGGGLKPTGWAVHCELHESVAPLGVLAEGHSAAFILPDDGIGRLAGTVDIDAAGGLVVRASMPDPPGGTAWDLVIPSGEDPGPNLFPTEGVLLHARVAQARVADVASLASKNKHENDIFGMQSQLFAAAMLSGTWELGLWGVAPGGKVPRIALAVGVRSPDVARAAATEYVASLAQRWSFSPRDQTIGGLTASCLTGLNLLPELAPCWTIRGNDLIAAWNADTLEFVLGGPTATSPGPSRSRVRIALGAFAEADAALTRAFAPRAPVPKIAYPWSNVELHANREDGKLLVELHATALGAEPAAGTP